MKKHFVFIFFLLTTFCFSQQKFENYKKLTAYTVNNWLYDGSCLVSYYLEGYEKFGLYPPPKIEMYDCEDLILKLLKVKEISKNWKSNETFCEKGWQGLPVIPNMIVLEFNKFKDIIYFTDKSISIYDPKLQRLYIDENNEFQSILDENKELKALFDTDYKIKAEEIEKNIPDSVNVNEIKINNKILYGLNRKDADSLVGGFDILETESSKPDFNSILYKYYSGFRNSYSHFHFYNENKLFAVKISHIEEKGDTFPDQDELFILGIQTGDKEEKLIKKFPASTKYIENQKKYFTFEGNYSIYVNFKDKKGKVEYILHEGKIIKIEINFNYPEKQ